MLLANPIQLEGELVFGKDDYLCDFARYVDNELGRMTLPEGYELLARFQNEDAWIKVEQVSARSNTYRVVGGWRPNDPKADGREQMLHWLYAVFLTVTKRNPIRLSAETMACLLQK